VGPTNENNRISFTGYGNMRSCIVHLLDVKVQLSGIKYETGNLSKLAAEHPTLEGRQIAIMSIFANHVLGLGYRAIKAISNSIGARQVVASRSGLYLKVSDSSRSPPRKSRLYQSHYIKSLIQGYIFILAKKKSCSRYLTNQIQFSEA
jgi:hypothetical protein